ncbi:MAG: hypothetical protein R6X02_19030 [Enhygromyxa sp.]
MDGVLWSICRTTGLDQRLPNFVGRAVAIEQTRSPSGLNSPTLLLAINGLRRRSELFVDAG